MYIATVPNRTSPPALLLRENYREGGKTKSRTLANLSKLPAERIEALRRAFRGDFDGVSGDESCDRVFGVLYALREVAKDIGITRVLKSASKFGKLLEFLVYARIAHRGSRLSAVRWARAHAVSEVLGVESFTEKDLYKALAWGAQEQERLEDQLYRDYVAKSGEAPALFLYDVTSVYLEGTQNEYAAYGYNRDGKKGKQQIVVGLLTGPDGEPLAIRVFQGNTADPTTVGAQIDTLAQRFKVEHVVFVGDRGMVKSAGKDLLASKGLHYISALTDPQVRTLLRTNVITPTLFDTTVREVEHEGKRLVLRKNPDVVKKEAKRREHKLLTLDKKIVAANERLAMHHKAKVSTAEAALTRFLATHKLAAFVTIALQDRTLSVNIDNEAMAHSSLLDGCYVMETDLPKHILATADVDARYRDLAKVERNFRSLKTAFLDVRPLFVRRKETTQGAVFVAFLALKLLRVIEKRLAKAFGTTNDNPLATTAQDAIDHLARFTFLKSQQHGITTLRLPRPDETIASIFTALHIPVPATSARVQATNKPKNE